MSAPVSLVIMLAVLFEATYGIYREERELRAKREALIRIKTRTLRSDLRVWLESELSLDASIDWEIWADESVMTDEFALVVSQVETQQRLRFWRRTILNRLVRIPPDLDPEIGVDSWQIDHYQYRHKITREGGPLKGTARFYIHKFWFAEGEPPTGPVVVGSERRWLPWLHWRRATLDYQFELVLTLGAPEGTYRTPVKIDLTRGKDLARQVS